MNTDVLVIGAGVIGLSVARELRKKGVKRVIIVDKGSAGREASWAAAGMLAPQVEADQADDFFTFCARSRDLYPKFADALKDETGVDIELDRSGTLYLGFGEDDIAEIRRRFEWQRSARLSVDALSAAECRSLEPAISERVSEGLFFPSDWQVENRKLLTGLIEYARLNDITVTENLTVRRLIIENGSVINAESNDGETISAGHFVLATGAWTSLIKIGEVPIPVVVKPIRGQMICFKPPQRRFRHVVVSRRGYIVPRLDGRLLAGATVEDAGFDVNTTEIAIDSLSRAALEIAPELADLEITENWAGLRPFAADGLPVIGKLPNEVNLLISTAHYRNGILLAPLTAKLVAEAIVDDRSSSFLSVFGPQRFRVAGGVS